MKKYNKLFSIILSLAITIGIVASPIRKNNILALESTGNITFDAFINDPRFTAGAAWPKNWDDDYDTLLSSWPSWTCCAYVADFVKYCYGKDDPWDATEYKNAYDIQAGDVVRLGSEDKGDGNTHYFVVLKRSGNSLYTAEGNMDGGKVRIGWNYTIESSNRLGGEIHPFEYGAAYHYGNAISGIYGSVSEPADDFYAFIISPNDWVKLESSSSNNNVQITGSANSETDSGCIWRFEKQSNGTYAIFNQRNGYVLAAYGAGTTNGTNIYTCKDYIGSKNQQWLLYDTGSGTVIKSANCDLVLDCAGGYTTAGTNIQLFQYNGTAAQKFNVYIIAKRWNPSSYEPFAYLIREEPWLHIENTDLRVVQIRAGANDSYDPKQIWWFCKREDGSFNISNEYNTLTKSAYLTAPSSLSSGDNVYTSNYEDSERQKWYIYKYEADYGSNYLLRAKGSELVLNCGGGSSNAGTRMNLTAFYKNDGQKFSIWHLANDNTTYVRPGNPNSPTITVPSSAVAGESFNVSWTSSPLKSDKFDKRGYTVEVFDSNGKLIEAKPVTSLSTSTIIYSAGTYSIQVRAVNTKYPGDSTSSVSAKKTIVVSQPVKTIVSDMISAVPDQEYTGAAIKPVITVKDGSTILKEGTDYLVEYSNNINVGKATITIT